MSDILFLTLDDPAGAPADDYAAAGALPWLDARVPDADAGDADRAARETRAGCAAARAGDWAAAADVLTASAHRRAALVAAGRARPTAAVRGWSDAAVLAAARDDALGAADALARARALCADDTPAALLDALSDVTAWLGALGGAAAPATCAPFGDVAPDGWADATPDLTPNIDPGVAGPAPDAPDPWIALEAWAEPAQTIAADVDASETAPDGLVFLPVDEEPAAAAATNIAEPAPRAPLAYLDLEGPVRPWERAHVAAPTNVAPAPATTPLAGPLAPALRNAKIDEAVALATAPSVQSPGRLRTLLGRLRRK